MSLPDYAELFVTLHKGNRYELNRVVLEEYSKLPTDRHVHEQLAGIPYIKQIISTNYDRMFELTHELLDLLVDSNKLPQLSPNKPTLYKIHGHLDDTRTLVITRSDYQRFFSKADPLLWKHLESLMASRTFVFVGYAVEDPNVLDVFLRVYDALGEHMRPAYVVSPNMGRLKQEVLEQRNIHYIDATGEEFVAELLADIKKNAIGEATRQEIDLRSTLQLLTNQGLKYLYNGDEKGINITDIRRIDGQTTGQLRFSAAVDSPLIQGLAKLSEGESLQVLKFSPDQLTSFSMQVEGFELPLGAGVTDFWIARTPTWHKQLTVRFASGLVLLDVNLRLYTSKHEWKVVAVDRYIRAVFTLPEPAEQLTRVEGAIAHASEEELLTGRASLDLMLTYSKRRPGFDSVESALTFADTMLNLGRGEAVELLENWAPVFRYPQQKPQPTLLASGESLRGLLLCLQAIEKCFGIRFQHFNLEGQNINELRWLGALISGEEIEENRTLSIKSAWEGSPEEKQQLFGAQMEDRELLLTQQSTPWTFDILGFSLQLTFQENLTLRDVTVTEASPGILQFSSSKVSRKVEHIIEAKVLTAPPPAAPQDPTPAELLDDMLPEDLLP
ncbi:SIR2 family NAD-dependent protein deacylase [Hymenobacter convexus]|uniref:SIR2 family NAD-dependent protein deacylase n=1 Tax=Hymenobacter sp. CA1UV-4 TaxID=3063782 RepID=UPI002714313A|nr:SIR2 family protein [Hymenobacter sp. CA1UV-4]MDO7854436.1 SIR2 family protein [Hymenobacter sp. CA1UV-4]